MNNTCSSIGLRYTLRMEGCDIFWVTPLSAFEHAPSYDLFSFPMDFLLIFFFKGDNWRIKSMRWNKHVFRWKTKAHLLTVISKRKKFVCCKNAHENSLGVTGECYAQYKMRSVIRGESPWKTMARKRSSGIVTNSNNWFWNFPLWNKYRLWSSYFFYNHSIKAFAFVLDWPKLGWIVRRKRRRRIRMTRYNFVYIFFVEIWWMVVVTGLLGRSNKFLFHKKLLRLRSSHIHYSALDRRMFYVPCPFSIELEFFIDMYDRL